MVSKTAMILAVLACAAGILWLAPGRRNLTNLTYSEFLEEVRAGRVAKVTVVESNSGAVEALCTLKEGKTALAVLPARYRDALQAMQEKQVNIEIRDSSATSLRLLMNATPFLLLLGIWVLLVTRKFAGPSWPIA